MYIKKIVKKILPKSLLNLWHSFFAWYGAVKYNNASEELLVIGVTGTSGKSSVIHFLRQALEESGFKVGSLSTIDFYVNGVVEMNDKKMTMLGKMEIQKYLREMVDQGCNIAIVETTSEGYIQHRHKYINYDMMILTNLYPEHIEAHGSFENYKKAKLGIFEHMKECETKELENIPPFQKTAILNGNSKYVKEFLKLKFDNEILFGRDDVEKYRKNIHLLASEVGVDKDGLTFSVHDREFLPKLLGEYNVMNILAAVSVLRVLDINWSEIQRIVDNLKPAPGRIEIIPEAEEKGITAIVDYAFEPVALEELYKVVDLLKSNRIIHVCGSTGGGRDKSRRGLIGELVGKKADFVIVTDEDPYDEDPIEIIDQVSDGAQKVGKKLGKNLFEVIDREEAINKAIDVAKKGDLILVTGKGSEQAMCVAEGKMIPWDDREMVRRAILNK